MFNRKRSNLHPKDGPWALLVLFTSTLTSAVFIGFVATFGVLLPTLIETFGSSIQETAWVPSIGLSLMTFLGPFTSMLVNRFGCRVSAIFGTLLCTVSLILTSFAGSIGFMYFSYSVLFGCGASFVNLPNILVIPEYFDKWQNLALGVSFGGQSAGTIIYGPLLEFLVSSLGWRWMFRVCAAMVFACVFAVCVYDPNDDNSEKNKKRKLFDCSVWKSRRFVLVLVSTGIGLFARSILLIHLAQYCKGMGISDANTGKLYLFLGVTSTISRPASGLLCQLKGVKDWLVTAASNILTAIIFLIMQYFTSYGLMVVFVVLFALFDGLFMAGVNIMAMSCFANPEKRSSCLGTIMMCASIFLACAPPIAGILADAYSYHLVFYIAGGFCLLAAVITFVVPFTQEEPSLPDEKDKEGPNELVSATQESSI